MTDNNDKLAQKLDTLIELMTPKAADPKLDAIKAAEEVLREALQDQFPKEKLDIWDLERLQMAQEVAKSRILPKALNKEDAQEEQDEEDEEPTEKLDSAEDLFKHSATWYTKEVDF